MRPGTRFICYDYLQVAGGAERVTLVMAEVLEGFEVLVSRVYPAAKPLLESRSQKPRTLGRWFTRGLTRIPEAMACFAWGGQMLVPAQTVIYSGFYAPLAVRWQKGGRRIYYGHSLPRFAYELRDDYRRQLTPLLRPLFDLFTGLLRWQYESAIRRMDVVLVNSDNVARRMQHYLGLQARVLHPPVDTEAYRHLGDEGYYLSVARLEPLKRVDLIIEAFKAMPNRPLIVASGGAQLERLKALAAGASHIRFTGWVDEPEMRRLIGLARATVYIPVDEDFGMSPVESMAAGKPVIGVAEGGLLETVRHAETGWLIDGEPTVEKLRQAVEQLEVLGAQSMRAACERQAGLFDRARFARSLRGVLERE